MTEREKYVEPLPQFKLDEIQGEINRLEKEKEYLERQDQLAIPAELVMESW